MTAQRITRADLESYAAYIATLSADLGIILPSDRLVLEVGSKSNGISYKLAVIHEGESGHSTFDPTGPLGFIGWTAKEAFRTLSVIRDTLSAVRYPRHTPPAS